MWIDNASTVDMLSYRPYAKLVYNIVTNKRMNPLTIGLFGSWGVGKSTLLKLIEGEIKTNTPKDKKVICVNINAWLFEGYEDAKAALMADLLKTIEDEETFPQQCKEGIRSLLKRIDYLKLAGTGLKKGIPLALSIASGNPMPLVLNCGNDMLKAFKSSEGIEEVLDFTQKFKEKFVKTQEEVDIVENVRVFREEFEKMLVEWEIDNLVVTIDDLDRCTPERIIDTLEAIKLFLSVNRTTFIVAVDERIVTYAIKKKYPKISEDTTDISKDYIEKIIQLPIRLPELSAVDIQNYLHLLVYELYLEDGFLPVIEQLYDRGTFFNDEVITPEMVNVLLPNIEYDKQGLEELTKTIQEISGIVSRALKGNPRQAKRFLNSFLVRKQMAELCFMGENRIDNEILAKLMTLEYIDISLFKELHKWYKQSNGIIEPLKQIYDKVKKGDELGDEYTKWNTSQVKAWIQCKPTNLYEKNLSRYFYLTRDVLVEDNNIIETLTVEEREILSQVVEYKGKETILRKVLSTVALMESPKRQKIIQSILNLYDNKQVDLNVLYIVFDMFIEYRYLIFDKIKQLKKGEGTFIVYPILKSFYDTSKEEVIPILQDLEKKKVLTKEALKQHGIIV